MGMVVVISLPLILFSLLLGFGCYFLGKAKGRQDIRTHAQVFGVPTPPPGTASPPPTYFKTDNSTNV
ncbi:uncharacterized protein LOC132268229 [Cornus florida]|uniref:uncharacterized protein LOC132268229 n=1 Tax=Cornus florida TaxID=4283 RepID=UPI0028984498|nr:uncharacterized protein LOC132268229 [Cornus florida]